MALTGSRIGVPLDVDRLHFELRRRGLTYTELAERAQVSPATLSRANQGSAVSRRVLERMAAVLIATPVIEGADLILAQPNKKIAAAPTPAATSEKEARTSGRLLAEQA